MRWGDHIVTGTPPSRLPPLHPPAYPRRMCNEFSRKFDLDLLITGLKEYRIIAGAPEGLPNIEPSASVRITDPSVIVRAVQGQAEVVTRRWSWPGQGGKPVYNYRSEGRDFRNSAKQGRCLVPVDGFYEFTAPEAGPGIGAGGTKAKRKDKWLFRWAGQDLFAIAGLWKRDEAAIPDTRGEAFTLLTCEPGPDIAPYHRRQVVLLDRRDWSGWLDGSIPAPDLLRPTPAGTLTVEPAGAPMLLL
jgi:putative SOS response-associated peptidase YedK